MKKQYRINGTIKVKREIEAESPQEAIEFDESRQKRNRDWSALADQVVGAEDWDEIVEENG